MKKYKLTKNEKEKIKRQFGGIDDIKKYIKEKKEKILNSDLSDIEKISQLEMLKTEILINNDPIKYFEGLKNIELSN